jgi:DNA-binding response OmpR family regulator
LGLGRKEFEIFIILAKKFGEVVSRDTLLEAGGDSGEVFDRTIDSHVSHIRKKLESAGVTEFRIMSVYGTGYRLDRK